MASRIVNYSHLNEEYYFDLEYDLKTESFSDHKNYNYSGCPVWKHRFDRTYVGISPVDFKMFFDLYDSCPRTGRMLEKGLIHCELNGEKKTIDLCEEIGELSEIANESYETDYFCFFVNDILQKNPVVQFHFLNYYFWTDFSENDIWFEYLDHPLTSLNNNFTTIGGWFNISNYSRSSSLAAKIVDVKKPLVIKKGDPLFRVRFFSDNLNDKFKLVKNKMREGYESIQQEKSESIRKDKKLMNDVLFGKSECPFHKYNKS